MPMHLGGSEKREQRLAAGYLAKTSRWLVHLFPAVFILLVEVEYHESGIDLPHSHFVSWIRKREVKSRKESQMERGKEGTVSEMEGKGRNYLNGGNVQWTRHIGHHIRSEEGGGEREKRGKEMVRTDFFSLAIFLFLHSVPDHCCHSTRF